MPEIGLQPKQYQILDLIQNSPARYIGMGGGRGAAKSGAADRIIMALLMDEPGIVACLVMRNWDQVRKYHVEPMLRTFPELDEHYGRSDHNLIIPVAGGKSSQLDFSYAESYADVERRFRSANYKYIIIDQAEQFTKEELIEIRKACRWPGGGAKCLFLFNMGGASIQELRKWFHTREYNQYENPEDYAFIHVYPWDNVEWVRDALEQDGLSPKDYYSWSDAERKEYAATRGEYTRALASDDEAIRNRDWESSWESLEGAYFGRVFDKQSTMVDPVTIAKIQKDWDKRWLSQDWGKSHFCCTQWHSMSTLAPSEAKSILGWDVVSPLKVIVTYRRLIVSEKTSTVVGMEVVQKTPEAERHKIKQYFLSPDAFGERDSDNTIADNQGTVLRKAGLPRPEPADTDRPGGWTLMHSLLWNTKTRGQSGDTVWLVSSECPEVLDAIPLLMRDPKDLDVVLKTDKGQAKLEQDVSECSRYGLKSMLGTVAKPQMVIIQEKVHEALSGPGGATAANIVYQQQMAKAKGKTRFGRQY